MTHISKLSVVCSNGHLNPAIYKIILLRISFCESGGKNDSASRRKCLFCTAQHIWLQCLHEIPLAEVIQKLIQPAFYPQCVCLHVPGIWAWSCLNNMQVGLLYCNGMRSSGHACGPIWEPFGRTSLPWGVKSWLSEQLQQATGK